MPKIRREKPTKKTVKVWDDDTADQLKCCFECMDWNVFIDSCDTNDELVDTVSDYIKFCEDSVIPTNTVTCYPNNKPWVTKELKAKLVQKRKFLRSHNRIELKLLQKQLDDEIKECKDKYK